MRVLCFCEKWASGGIESFLTNAFEHMDLSSVQIDVVANCRNTGIYDERLVRLGVSLRVLSGSNGNLVANLSQFGELLRRQSYDVVHLNIFEGTALMFARAAKRAGIGRVIAHSHNTDLHSSALRPLKLALHRGCVHVLADCADVRLAPSASAASFMFGSSPWELLKNGIDCERFAFSSQKRASVRADLGLSQDQPVVGIVGRLASQKNQHFLIEVLARLPQFHLLIIGEGQDKHMLQQFVQQLALDDRVTFLEPVCDLGPYYSAMDVLCVPSLFEAFGIAALEAQAADLPVICSPAVPGEARATSRLTVCELDVRVWERALRGIADSIQDRVMQRSACAVRDMNLAGYNCRDTALRLFQIYCGDDKAKRSCNE